MVGVAALLPARGSAGGVVSVGTTVAISTLFFLIGVRLSPAEAWTGLRHWRLHLTVFATTFAVFPVLGLAAHLLSPWLLTPELYIGVMFMCTLPSTVQSSIAFTSIARGNVAAAICSASISNLLGVVVSPLLVALTLGSAVHIRLESVLTIGAEILLPFVLGQATRPWLAEWEQRHARATKLVDRGSILLVVYSAFSVGVINGIWHQVSVPRLGAVLVVDAVLLAAVMSLTLRASRALGFDRADRTTIVFCGSKKSLTTGVPIASVLFPAATVGLVILPLMLFHQMQLMVCATLARRWGAQRSENPEPGVVAVSAAASPAG